MASGLKIQPAAAIFAAWRACDFSHPKSSPPFSMGVALDLFLEEDLEWTRRLARGGVPVGLHVIPGAYHGFGMAQDSPQAAQLQGWRSAALARAFAASITR